MSFISAFFLCLLCLTALGVAATDDTSSGRYGVDAPSAAPVAATVAGAVRTVRARLRATLAGTDTNPWRLERPALGVRFGEFFLSVNEQNRAAVDALFQPLLPGAATTTRPRSRVEYCHRVPPTPGS